MFLISIIIITAPFVSLSDDQNFVPHMKNISPQLYLALSNDSKVYNLSSVADMMNATRRDIIFNTNLFFYTYYMKQRLILCYSTTLTYKTAMWDIFRYFDIRDIYVNNLEYEVGYLTQEVIYHYQVVLEIYQMVDNRYIKHPTRNFGPVNYVFFMYTILLEKCKIIIHLCNMMHELEEKYKKTKSVGVFAEHDAHSGDSFSRVNMSKVDQERIAYQKSLEQKAKDDRKKQQEEKKYYKEVKKFGKTTKKRRKIKKKSPWPLDYGWSIEDW